jgi:hypothetical protein
MNTVKKLGRKSAIETDIDKVKMLSNIQDINYTYKRMLYQQGFLDRVVQPMLDKRKGRKNVEYVLSKKGKSILNISEN